MTDCEGNEIKAGDRLVSEASTTTVRVKGIYRLHNRGFAALLAYSPPKRCNDPSDWLMDQFHLSRSHWLLATKAEVRP